MTERDPLTYLDEVDVRTEAATEGPWWADTHVGGDGFVVMGDGFRRAHLPRLGADLKHHDRQEDDAEFIAHARQDLPALSKALRAVLAIHPREVIAVHEGYGEEAWCPRCQEHYPCSTVWLITEALEARNGD